MHLLVVEDERRIATALKRGLEADGFTVDVAFTGDDGLWYARESSYDLIVLDLMLPGRSGFEVCRELRESGDWTPIIVLTAKEGSLDEQEALETAPTTTSASPSPTRYFSCAFDRCCAAQQTNPSPIRHFASVSSASTPSPSGPGGAQPNWSSHRKR